MRAFFNDDFMDTVMATVPYLKPHQNETQLLHHLLNKGLHLNHDKDEIIQVMKQIGYYRLKPYLIPFLDTHKQFYPNTFFHHIHNLYVFDETLRGLFFKWIQIIETGVRTFFNETMLAKTQNPFWYLDSALFHNYDQHLTTVHKIRSGFQSSNDESCQHYQQKYHNDFCPLYRDVPPAWMALEYISFGNLVSLMSAVSDDVIQKFKLNKAVNEKFKISKYRTLVNWLDVIRDVRNVVCHHSRLFNRNFPAPNNVKALFYDRAFLNVLPTDDERNRVLNRLYGILLVLQRLLHSLGQPEFIGQAIQNLFQQHQIDVRIQKQMGFIVGWENECLFPK